MDALAVSLLLFILGNIWGGGWWLFKKVTAMDKKLDEATGERKSTIERVSRLEIQVDDHEGRLYNIEEGKA